MATARGAPRATPPPDEEKLSVKTLSRSVAAVVESAGELSYADLAAATAAELARTHSDARKDTDDRTFRRRIYDVVAVLAAAGVVARRHSSVSWKGFPSSAAPRPRVSSEDAVIAELTQKINEKRDALKKAQEANALLHRLAERNALVEAGVGPTGPVPPERRIPLPFILLTTDADAQVDLQISDTRYVHLNTSCNSQQPTNQSRSSELLFKFTHPFEIHDVRLPSSPFSLRN